MIAATSADTLAGRYGLGDRPRLEGPVARGQLGQVWRLTTTGGSYAVKEWFAGPDLEATRLDAEFSELARAAGVVTPRVVRTVTGDVTTSIDGALIRVHEWVELQAPTRKLDPSQVGETLARLHLAAPPSHEPVERWFSEGFGRAAWCALHERLVEEGAPFAAALGSHLEALLKVEAVMEPHESPILCHRDLWSDNVLTTADAHVCIIDFENLGPADPSQELAMVVYEFGDDDPGRARTIHEAYVAAGGPGRVSRPAHFTMLIAEVGHICHLAASRWIGEEDPDERRRLDEWLRRALVDPVTLPRIERALSAVG